MYRYHKTHGPMDPLHEGGSMGSLDKFSAASLATHLGGRVGKEEDSEAIQSERESELYCSILHDNIVTIQRAEPLVRTTVLITPQTGVH